MPTSSTCEHGHHRLPCPWPGCHRGIPGEQLVICGPRGLRYLIRGFDKNAAGDLVVSWVERPKVEITLARIVRKAEEKALIRHLLEQKVRLLVRRERTASGYAPASKAGGVKQKARAGRQ